MNLLARFRPFLKLTALENKLLQVRRIHGAWFNRRSFARPGSSSQRSSGNDYRNRQGETVTAKALKTISLLRESGNNWGEILDALPVAFYITDADGRLTFFNAAAAKLSGRKPE